MTAVLRSRKEEEFSIPEAYDKKSVLTLFDQCLKQTAGRELPPNAVIQKQIPTTNDVKVFVVGKPNGMPRAIYKFTTSRAASASLLHHARTLKSQEKLFETADLGFDIPRIFAIHQNDMTVGVIESMLPGMTLQEYIQEKGREHIPELMEQITSKLKSFYAYQQDVINVVDHEIEQLVHEPIELITHRLGKVSRLRYGRKLRKLSIELTQALSWQQLTFGPIHGDLCPGNIILDPITHEMTGLIDWEIAQQSSYSAVDLFHLILTVSAQVDRTELGTTVRQALKKPRWFNAETYAIADENKLVSADSTDRTLILLAWLHHLKSNLSKSEIYSKHRYWKHQNIIRVLKKL